jgi:competence protein ComEA
LAADVAAILRRDGENGLFLRRDARFPGIAMAHPAMGRPCGATDTACTGGDRQPAGNATLVNPRQKEIAMKTFTAVPRSLTLGMLLAASALFGTAIAGERVNINTADAATIDAGLVNIGRSKAEAIVAYRKEHGAFKNAEQLAQVKGIGLKTVEKNRDRIAVDGGAPAHKQAAAPRKPQKK